MIIIMEDFTLGKKELKIPDRCVGCPFIADAAREVELLHDDFGGAAERGLEAMQRGLPLSMMAAEVEMRRHEEGVAEWQEYVDKLTHDCEGLAGAVGDASPKCGKWSEELLEDPDYL